MTADQRSCTRYLLFWIFLAIALPVLLGGCGTVGNALLFSVADALTDGIAKK